MSEGAAMARPLAESSCPVSAGSRELSRTRWTWPHVLVGLFILAFIIVVATIDVKANGGTDDVGFILSVVVSVVAVIAVTIMLVMFNPRVYACLFRLDPSQVPVTAPYWYTMFITGFLPYLFIWSAMFFLGDYWIGRTGENSQSHIDGHAIWSIIGLNTALGLAFGFLFGHCGAKGKYQNGKTNFVGIFSPVLVMLIWIFLFTTQGIVFYIFSTHTDNTLKMLGQFVYWATALLVWAYLLCGVFVLPESEAGYIKLQQVLNIVQTLMFGMLTWEMLLLGVVMASEVEHPHVSRAFVYMTAGLQAQAYAFVTMSVITSIAKQVTTAASAPRAFGEGNWMTGPGPASAVQ